jgi:hypothetical protein
VGFIMGLGSGYKHSCEQHPPRLETGAISGCWPDRAMRTMAGFLLPIERKVICDLFKFVIYRFNGHC